jgi:hypothetical protein
LADAFVELLAGESKLGTTSVCAFSKLENTTAISEANVMYALILMVEILESEFSTL